MKNLKFATILNFKEVEVTYEITLVGNVIKKVEDNTEIIPFEQISLKDLENLQGAADNNAASFLEDRRIKDSHFFGNIMSNAFSNF